MTVSLIISTYNSPQMLELCLKSVLQQSVLPDEVLIADDGSKEDTKKIHPCPLTMYGMRTMASD